jgi:hypothetical protein
MNEIELIRQQLAAEREHACAAVRACATALERAAHTTPSAAASLADLCQATIAFVAATLTSFEERDLRLAELVRARLPPEDPARRALEEALARPGGNRELLEQLAAVSASGAAAGGGSALATWRQVAHALEAEWRARREALDELFATRARVADWRRVGGIDADWILAERQRYARLQAQLAGEGRPSALGEGA